MQSAPITPSGQRRQERPDGTQPRPLPHPNTQPAAALRLAVAQADATDLEEAQATALGLLLFPELMTTPPRTREAVLVSGSVPRNGDALKRTQRRRNGTTAGEA